MADIIDLPILSVGTHNGYEVTPETLDAIERNFARLKGLHDVPVKLGHGEGPLAGIGPGGQPSLGWLEGVRRVGGKLLATVGGMPRFLREAVNLGRYRKVSAELYPAWEATGAERNLKTGATGPALQAIALLGASIPAIRDLGDIPRMLAAEGYAARVALAAPGEDVVAVESEAAPGALERAERRLDVERARLVQLAADVDMLEAEDAAQLRPGTYERLAGPGRVLLAHVERELRKRYRLGRTSPDARRQVLAEILGDWGMAKVFADVTAEERRAITDAAADTGRRGGVARFGEGEAAVAVTKDGGDGLEARLGGRDRVETLHRLAEERGLDIAKARNLEALVVEVFTEAALPVAACRSFEECLHALARERWLRLAALSHAERQPLVAEVARRREDLVPRYGFVSRDQDPGTGRKPRPTRDELAAQLNVAVVGYLERHGLDPDRDRFEATRTVLKLHPELRETRLYDDGVLERYRASAFGEDAAGGFEERIDAELRAQDVPNTAANRRKAAEALARRGDVELPIYGSGDHPAYRRKKGS